MACEIQGGAGVKQWSKEECDLISGQSQLLPAWKVLIHVFP